MIQILKIGETGWAVSYAEALNKWMKWVCLKQIKTFYNQKSYDIHAVSTCIIYHELTNPLVDVVTLDSRKMNHWIRERWTTGSQKGKIYQILLPFKLFVWIPLGIGIVETMGKGHTRGKWKVNRCTVYVITWNYVIKSLNKF